MEHCTSYHEATLLLRFLTFSYARLLSIKGAAPAVHEPHPQSVMDSRTCNTCSCKARESRCASAQGLRKWPQDTHAHLHSAAHCSSAMSAGT